ncbi:MAG: competence/damage-inducible protein A, partial [Acetoanaerobium sp.]|nr:competence/damage-inducible protein A [Acetoanaerobium sp.]
MRAEIICIGTELLMGEILNTNAKYIAEKLQEVGVDLLYQTTVGDNETRITECLDIAFSRVDIVITTG